MFRVTVYFDTSFYVYLQRADAELAITAVKQLNALRVRRVESPELFFELDVSPNADGKRTLIERLQLWTIPPLRLGGANLHWLALDERPPELDQLREAKRQMAIAHAFSASAAQPLPTRDAPILEHVLERQFGVKTNINDAASSIQLAKLALERLSGASVPPSLDPFFKEMRALVYQLEGGVMDTEAFVEAATSLPGRMRAAVEAEMPGVGRTDDVREAVLTGNGRARDVALGRASDKAERRHSSTIADLEHLSVFLHNADLIDLLMMDAPQLASLDQRAVEEIEPVRGRIFNAADLASVVQALRTHVKRLVDAP